MPQFRWPVVASLAILSAALPAWAAGTDAPATPPAAAPAAPPAAAPATPPAATSQSDTAPEKLSLEPVIVRAQKREEELQNVPLSITAITAEQIRDADITNVKQASFYVPDLVISEFTNRRLSFPFIRGVGSGQNSPAVTTYIDDVPQLSFATSNQELTDIQRFEFLRGPQGTLYGRNALGGVINIYSNPPSNKLEADWTGQYGNYNAVDQRGMVNIPIIKDVLSIRFSGGWSERDGYTRNTVTGHDLDGKNALFGRLAVFFKPTDRLDFTWRVNGERDRDGDYALGDLASIRKTPFRVSHDFEGFSNRDIAGTSLTANYQFDFATLTSITAYKGWQSQDVTDLDESPLDGIRRNNQEKQREFTQEIRLGSPKDNPLSIANNVKFSWLVGVFGFNTDYQQNAVNDFRPGGVPFITPIPFMQTDTADINTTGGGVFGQGTLTFFDKLDITAGARADYETAEASLGSFTNPPLGPPSASNPSKNFSHVSPKLSIAYHWSPNIMTYASVEQGYKAGGFNATAPTGKSAFDPEKAWSYEVGAKTTWLDKKLQLNVDMYYIDWTQMQLDVPTGSPGVFFIDNVGKAYSFGFEGELTARPIEPLEVFTGLAWGHARFEQYIQPSGASAAGNTLPFAPSITWNAGSQYTLKINRDLHAFVRGEFLLVSQYNYDASAAAKQDLYTLTNFRVGVGGKLDALGGQANWKLEGYVNNAFDTHYVPLAFPFQLAPSGYVGEMGPPITYGVSMTVGF